MTVESPLRVRRVERALTVAWWALVALAGVSVLVHVFSGWPLGISGGFPVELRGDAVAGLTVQVREGFDAERAEVRGVTARLLLTSPGGIQPYLIEFFAFASHVGVWLYVIYILRAFVRTIREGKTFDTENPARLNRIGAALIALEVASWIHYKWLNFFLPAAVQVADGRISAYHQVDWTVLLIAGVLLVMATAFKAGVELEEEQKLTV